jgi:hypothetical protein
MGVSEWFSRFGFGLAHFSAHELLVSLTEPIKKQEQPEMVRYGKTKRAGTDLSVGVD